MRYDGSMAVNFKFCIQTHESSDKWEDAYEVSQSLTKLLTDSMFTDVKVRIVKNVFQLTKIFSQVSYSGILYFIFTWKIIMDKLFNKLQLEVQS
jgi:hypothetical protein